MKESPAARKDARDCGPGRRFHQHAELTGFGSGLLAQRKLRTMPPWLSALAAAVVLLTGSPAASRAVVLDGIPQAEVAAFALATAQVDESLVITSLQDNAVVPRNFLYPLVEWRVSPGSDGVFLVLLQSGKHELRVYLKRKRWQPAGREFEVFLKDGAALLTVYALSKGQTTKSRSVRLVVSPRSLSESIAYRVVQPLFDPSQPNAIKIYAVDRKTPGTLVEFTGTCVGCHAYSAEAALFNIKRKKDRRLVTARQNGGATSFGDRSLGDYSFLALSPDKRFAAFVAGPVGDLETRKTVVEPFDYPYRQADISVYDLANNAAAPLPGASDLDVVEDMPFFSPDGGELVFSRSRYGERDGAKGVISMDLFRIPFNAGRGGEAVPIAAASGNGLHHYFARYSPDGKWLSFCRGDGFRGIYARTSSDIFLMSRETGAVTRMNLNREDAMDSWHGWSSDSRWLIFSSSREPSGLTALYLVSIDEEGKDQPPVKLVGYDDVKINTPQFVPKGLDLEGLSGVQAFIDTTYSAPKMPRP